MYDKLSKSMWRFHNSFNSRSTKYCFGILSITIFSGSTCILRRRQIEQEGKEEDLSHDSDVNSTSNARSFLSRRSIESLNSIIDLSQKTCLCEKEFRARTTNLKN